MRKKRAPSNTEGWDVVVVAADKYKGASYYGSATLTVIEGELAVKLTYKGKVAASYGTVKITEPDFEERITSMKAEAQEKASGLNAVGAVV